MLRFFTAFNILMKSVINAIETAANFKESITILAFKDDGILEILSKLLFQKDVNESFQHNTKQHVVLKKIELSLIDKFLNDDFEKVFLEFLGFSTENLENFFSALEKGVSYMVMVTDIDSFSKPEKVVEIFDQLKKRYGDQIDFIYVLESPRVFTKLETLLEPSSSFFENIYIHPLNGEDEQNTLELFCKERYGEIKDKKVLNKIFKDSSGHFELYKKLYKAEITGNFQSLDSYISRLVSSLGEENLRIFRKIISGVNVSQRDKDLVEIYRKLGFLKNGRIQIPILEKEIVDISPKQDIFYNQETGQILLDNIEELSKSEITLLRVFLENPEEIVSKETLGDALWGKKANAKYSPLAIDQLIFRLRMKISKLNLKGEIKTSHGKCYVFVTG